MSAKLRILLPEVGTPTKPGVATTLRVPMSMMLTLPAGLMPPPIEASFATSSVPPPGVKVSISGNAPTLILLMPEASDSVVVS